MAGAVGAVGAMGEPVPSAEAEPEGEFIVVHLAQSENVIVCGNDYLQGNLNADGTLTVKVDDTVEVGHIKGAFRSKDEAMQCASQLVAVDKPRLSDAPLLPELKSAEVPTAALAHLDPTNILIPVPSSDLRALNDRVNDLKTRLSRQEDLLLNTFAKLHSTYELAQRQQESIDALTRFVVAKLGGELPQPINQDTLAVPSACENSRPSTSSHPRFSVKQEPAENACAHSASLLSVLQEALAPSAGPAFPQPAPHFDRVPEAAARAAFEDGGRAAAFARRVAQRLFAAEQRRVPLAERPVQRVLELRRLLSHFYRPAHAQAELDLWQECVQAVDADLPAPPMPRLAALLCPKRGRGRPRKYASAPYQLPQLEKNAG